jgi:hypothetical protein|tara:strand:- start:442 stop:1110 length:669 start_codon:yes stop_codon:yes gene_type:complete
MKVKDARLITGHKSGLGKPSKMPGFSTSLPASLCKVGSRLAEKAGSTCSKCYALKGNYLYKSVQQGLRARYDALTHPLWVDAMTMMISRRCTIGHREKGYFRWHDSGDLQSLQHFMNIVEVCRRTPGVRHWLPTREVGILKAHDKAVRDGSAQPIPGNLTVRVSSFFTGQKPMKRLPDGVLTSTVSWRDAPAVCPASKQDNKCGPCRNCWDKAVPNVDYPQH